MRNSRSVPSAHEATTRFSRVRRGYDPVEVESHLDQLASETTALRAEYESYDAESLEVVLRATRRSIDDAIQDGKERAAAILRAAEEDAERVVGRAQEEATRVLAEAGAEARRLEQDGRERYLELGRLAEVREQQLAELQARADEQRDRLRRVAEELRMLVDGGPEHPGRPSATRPDDMADLLTLRPGREAVNET